MEWCYLWEKTLGVCFKTIIGKRKGGGEKTSREINASDDRKNEYPGKGYWFEGKKKQSAEEIVEGKVRSG